MHAWRCSEWAGRNASEHRAGLERFNVGADPPYIRGRPPSLVKFEVVESPSSNDPIQRSHRGIGDGMSTQGKSMQHGKPHRREARSQLDSREGQAGSHGVADRPVVPLKPGNAGGGKGPEFKEVARRGNGQGEWASLPTSRSNRSRSEGGDPPSPTGHTVVLGASLSESRMREIRTSWFDERGVETELRLSH